MCLARCLAAASIFWIGHVPVLADQGPDNPFLTQEGRLVATLELRDAQEGFVGVTGTIWMVKPDGTYRVSHFVNDEVKPPHSQGHLKKDEIASIAETMGAQRFGSLPREIGGAPPVNARRLILRFDRKTSSIVLQPNQSLEAAAVASQAEPGTAQARLLTIAETIRATLEQGGSH